MEWAYSKRWGGSATTIETIESEDALTFLASRQRRADDFTGLAVGAAAVWYGFHLHSKLFIAFAIFGLGSELVSFFRSRLIELRVTHEGVTITSRGSGDIGKERHLAWSDVLELSHDSSDEEDDVSLRVKLKGSGSVSLLRHLQKDQADEIVEAIYRRFPDLSFAPGFGDSGVISLGLTN